MFNRLQTFVLAAVFLAMLVPVNNAHAKGKRTENRSGLAVVDQSARGADGELRYRSSRRKTEFSVEVEDLTPGVYDLFVDNIFRGNITVQAVNGGSEGEIEFRNPVQPGKFLLDFDPREVTAEIKLGSTVMLSGMLPTGSAAGNNNIPFTPQKQKVSFDNPAGSDASGKVKLKSRKKKVDLTFEFRKLAPGAYSLEADGVVVADFVAKGKKSKVRFSSRPGRRKLPLTFDPTNTRFQLMAENQLVMQVLLPGDPVGGGILPLGEQEVDLVSTGADRDASGSARLRRRDQATDFRVEVEDLDVGTYELFVDGIFVGSMDVTLRQNSRSNGNDDSGDDNSGDDNSGDDNGGSLDGTQGEIEFRNPPEQGKLFLDFDPAGKTIQIVKDGTVYLGVLFPES